jgi:hypothetical protein
MGINEIKQEEYYQGENLSSVEEYKSFSPYMQLSVMPDAPNLIFS